MRDRSVPAVDYGVGLLVMIGHAIGARERSRQASAVSRPVFWRSVTRAGRRVATISPAPRANGAALRAVFERCHNNPALDDTLAARVDAARQAVSAELDANPWEG